MISLCYLIVCVYLLYSLDQAETFLPKKRGKVGKGQPYSFLKSLCVENQHEILANIISPYWNLTYDEQLDKKQNYSKDIVDMIMKRSMRIETPINKMLPIVPSPVTIAYRNRDEFKIRPGVDGNIKTVGISVGYLKMGKAFSIPPTKIITMKESHKIVAQVFEDFIRLSPVPPSIHLNDGGHWRKIMIRSNEEGDVMASVVVQPKGYTNETIQEQKQELKKYFFKHLPNITLFHQQCPRIECTQDLAPYILLYGKPYIMETLNGFKYKLLPETPFHNNKFGAEVLYDAIIKTAKLKPNTTVLDVCSSSGTIGLMVSKFVNKAFVLGFNPQVINYGKQCAQFNNITNTHFFLGNVDQKLKSILYRLPVTTIDIVAIVNPGHTGLDYEVIGAIRRAKKISKIVYISSRPHTEECMKNFVYLCSNNKYNITQFRLTKAISIDLYPQTAQVEFILIFQRPPSP